MQPRADNERWLIPLADVQPDTFRWVGRKAAALAALLRAGFMVPAGFVIPVSHFQEAYAPYRAAIQAALTAGPLTDRRRADAAAAEIQRVTRAISLPAELRQALASLPAATHRWAVRSSAVAEDRADFSFAGVYETRLGAAGREVADAVLAVWQSYYHAGALAARAAAGGNHGGGMGVLLQPLLEADCAGVAFSLNPIAPAAGELVLVAAWGLGAGVVSGTVPGDMYTVDRERLTLIRQTIVEKPLALAISEPGVLTRQGVPAARRRAAVLPPPWIARLAQVTIAVESELGSAQELEWAIVDNTLWLLQSRPQTALPDRLTQRDFPMQQKERRYFWQRDDRPVDEPDPPPPLLRDYTEQIHRIREESCRFFGVDRNLALTWFNGRAYVRPVPLDIPAGDLRVRRAFHDDLADRLFAAGQTSWDYWGPEIESANLRLARFDVAGASPTALADHLADALATARRHSMLHPFLWFRPRPALEAAYAAVAGKASPERDFLTRYLAGRPTVLTALIDDLYALAAAARDVRRAAAIIADPPDDAMERLAALPEAAPILDRLNEILEMYGERSGNGYGSESSLLTPTWREQPVMILRLAAPYLPAGVVPPADARAAAQQALDEEIEALCRRCTDPKAVAQFKQQLENGRRAFTVLETHNHFIDQMAGGYVRRALLAAARRLADAGLLSAEDDVFWLTFAEIDHGLRQVQPESFAPRIAARRAEHRRWRAMTPPAVLGPPEPGLPPRPPLIDELNQHASAADRLRGSGAGVGTVSGRCRVLQNADLFMTLQPGDILVARNIGPRWTPVIPILSGLLLDEGSIGQHAAATAREHGVPVIVGLKHATAQIADGDTVTFDGRTGIVHITARR